MPTIIPHAIVRSPSGRVCAGIIRRWAMISLAVGVICIAMFPPSALAQESSASPNELSQWALQLGDDNYHLRQQAAARLRRADVASIDALAEAMATADMEIIERGSKILTEVAMAHSPSDDGGAWRVLRRMSQRGIGLAATRSQLAVEEVRKHRAMIAQGKLVAAAAKLDKQGLIVQSSKHYRNQLVLTLDGNFDDDEESLSWIRWLDEVKCVMLDGPAITPAIINEVVQMRDLQTLFLNNGTADRATIEPLLEAKKLQYLEFQYTVIPEDAATMLPELPVRMGLSLNGTGVKSEQVDLIAQAAPGLAIEYKQGGFLGVISDSFSDECAVQSVVPGKSAESAGIRSGDVIIRVDDVVIGTFDELRTEISKHAPGEKLVIRLKRRVSQEDTVEMETTLTLGRQDSTVPPDPRR